MSNLPLKEANIQNNSLFAIKFKEMNDKSYQPILLIFEIFE